MEQRAEDTYLAFGGTVTAHAGTPVLTISASLDGYIAHCDTKLDAFSLYTCVQGRTSCTSKSHAVTLTRR